MAQMIFADHRTSSTFEEIPVINFHDAFGKDPCARRRLANRIRDACINVGFFYIEGHEIPESTIQKATEAGHAFFGLPLDEKLKLDINKSPNYKGYTALLSENTDPEHGKGDLHEGFDLGFETLVAGEGGRDASRKEGSMSGLNVWPPPHLGLHAFREELLRYYHEALHVGKLLFPLFALALDLPEDFFDEKTTQSAAIMRILRYPPQDPSEVDDSGEIIGIGAHTDYECFTILWQDTAGGLQVQNAEGKWIDAVPIPGTLVVNLGDQFARWTNDVFKSTRHRAINHSGVERYSMPLFFGTDYDVLLEPIPSCVDEDMPPKYEVMKAGDYVKNRLDATYKKDADTP